MNAVSFPKPDNLINLNDRKHWSSRAAQTKVWRTAAFYAARSAVINHDIPQTLQPSVVSVILPVGSLNVRRDPHNFVATVKPIIDGFVDAGLWPDDNSDWVTTTEPTFRQGGFVVVNITPRGES